MKRAAMLGASMFTIGIMGCEGCDERKSALRPEKTEVTQTRFDMSAVITRGNHSYIPVKRAAAPGDIPSDILDMLSSFEAAHSDLEIVSWYIEKRQKTGEFSTMDITL